MLRLVAAQVLRRRGRTLAVLAAIVVAAVSFSLLTSAVATSRLQVQGTVEANFRSAYDILVRPAGSTTPLERQRRLVQENYLSGIYGGISVPQYHRIQRVPGVQVAAPVAMVGYMLPSLFRTFDVTGLVTGDRREVFRIRPSWITDRGLTSVPDADRYVYVTGDRVRYVRNATQRDPLTGSRIEICRHFRARLQIPRSPFDLRRRTQLSCFSTNPPTPRRYSAFPHGHVAIYYSEPFPLLLAAIDPAQEAKLVGLDTAMVSGRYLTSEDHTRTVHVGNLKYKSVPVVMGNRPLTDDTLRFQVQRLSFAKSRAVPGHLASPDALRWLQTRTGPTVKTAEFSDADLYPDLLRVYTNPKYRAKAQYWSAGPVGYQHTDEGHLVPEPRHNPAETWIEPLLPEQGGYFAPPENADVGFRRLHEHIGANTISDGTLNAPIVRQVGVFDPNQITGFSQLSQVPLTTYYPPDAEPGDARTERLLDGKPLLPNNNLPGYLQQPPMMLTTLRSLPTMTDSTAFYGAKSTAQAPISVIRVRVAGVTGTDELSRERVRLVAEAIQRETGLDVDVTIGSSPTPQLIDLPAGHFGRPTLTLKEGWVQKGAAVKLLSAIDSKSLALFVLVLIVCLLFLLNATVAAVRTRRAELGVLACLGWPARRIFALLEVELLATGLVAGLVGTGLAAGLTALFGLDLAWWQLAAITPVATLLAAAAGLGPAWRASHARPVEAITPAVRPPRRAGRVNSVTKLAVVGLTRWPGRTLLGAASLFIGVAALAVLIAIQSAFQGGVAGTLLGDVVAVQVRSVDYLATGLTIALGAFAVADIAYLNIAERTAEIGTFRASGWAESHLRRLFGTEAVLTATLGAVTGAAVGVGSVALLFPIPWTTVLTAAAAAAGIGITAAVIALTIPLTRLSRLAPATAITTE